MYVMGSLKQHQPMSTSMWLEYLSAAGFSGRARGTVRGFVMPGAVTVIIASAKGKGQETKG